MVEGKPISKSEDTNGEETAEDVKWVKVVTGGAGGCAWPGFVAVVEVEGQDGMVARATLRMAHGDAGKASGEVDGGTIFACQWDANAPDIKIAAAVMLETSQNLYVFDMRINVLL